MDSSLEETSVLRLYGGYESHLEFDANSLRFDVVEHRDRRRFEIEEEGLGYLRFLGPCCPEKMQPAQHLYGNSPDCGSVPACRIRATEREFC